MSNDDNDWKPIELKLSVKLSGDIISTHIFHYIDPLNVNLIKSIIFKYSNLTVVRLIRQFKRKFRLSKTQFLNTVGITKQDYIKVMTLSKDVTQELLDKVTLPLAFSNMCSWVEEVRDAKLSDLYIDSAPIQITDVKVS